MTTLVFMRFMRISREGFQQVHCAATYTVPLSIQLRDSYEISDGEEQAEYMVWDMTLQADEKLGHELKNIVLVPQFSRQLH